MTDADVLIVGGGFAGLVMGELLAIAGIRCRIMEAGPALRASRELRDAASRQQHPNPSRWESRLLGVQDVAAELPDARTRIRAVGGRSLVWGGWCERFESDALVDAKRVGAEWPVSIAELAPYYRTIERLLTVRTERGAPETRRGLHARAPRIARDGERLRTALSLRRARQRVTTEAVVRRVLFQDSRVCGVEYWDRAGRLERARAPVVVLCASPEETIRILLTEPPASIADRAHLIGRGLVDHLLVSYVAVAPTPAKPSAAFIPRFVNTSRATKRDYVGGFSMEVHAAIAAAHLGANWCSMLGVDKQHAHEMSVYIVTAMGDAMPNRKRFVELHPSATDTLGRRVPVIHQATSENDRLMVADMKQTALSVIDAMTPRGSIIVPFRDPRRHRALFHEAGGCRMGRDPKTSVTDPMGRVRGAAGLYVADASVFPTGGDRHPTLTLLALAARTADSIVRASKAA